MKSILEELWHGNLDPSWTCHRLTPEVKELTGSIADHYESLLPTLTDRQKEILEKFDERRAELASIHEREIFVYAFRLGARMAVEVMSPDVQ